MKWENEKFDVIVVMNVLHEVAIVEISNIIENARRSIAEEGLVIVVDTLFVPEGEPRFVPYYKDELKILFNQYEDKSYCTKSGIPILFYVIEGIRLPCFHNLPTYLRDILEKKRDDLSQLSVEISHPENNEHL